MSCSVEEKEAEQQENDHDEAMRELPLLELDLKLERADESKGIGEVALIENGRLAVGLRNVRIVRLRAGVAFLFGRSCLCLL